MMIEWRAVEGWPYEVSRCGLVRRAGPGKSTRVGRVLGGWLNQRGYRRVNLWAESRRWTASVHRLVAGAFVPGYRRGLHVNHIDGDKLNNHADNLEWVTCQENSDHAYTVGLGVQGERIHTALLNENQVVQARHRYAAGGVTQRELAEEYGVHLNTMHELLRGKKWKHVPMP